METTGRQMVISGRVQGVGFRYFCVRHAQRLGIRGFVKNLPDGSLLVRAYGTPGAIEEFTRLVIKGPSFALVTKAETDIIPDNPESGSFEVRY
ncbi:acylphosphatase [Candidatus Mcinerneyibacteriota bacterium]|nr:acylphosphatase [Candidatus Mcinerneyibacteriota bacterium]